MSVDMVKGTYHPNAHLSTIRNIKRGLKARTQILNFLEERSADAKNLSKEAGMHYGVVMHHLKLLQREGVVGRRGDKPHTWALTGAGQRRLMDAS